MEDLHLEVVHEMIVHGKRLLAAFYSISKSLSTKSNIDFLSGPEFQKILKKLPDGKKIPDKMSLKPDTVKKAGEILRYPYCVLRHFRQWQVKSHKAIIDSINHCRVLDFDWNYLFSVPIVQLFTLYVKLHLYLIHLLQQNDLVMKMHIYKHCLDVSKSPDDNVDFLINFLKERETLKPLEAELQFLTDPLMSYFKETLGPLRLILGPATNFPWKLLNLSDCPEPLIKQHTFFKADYLVLTHLTEICESFLLYGVICSQILAADQVFSEVFWLTFTHRFWIRLYGDHFADLRQVLPSVRKYKDKRLEIDLTVLEKFDEKMSRNTTNLEYRRRKLSMILQEFLSAVQADTSVFSSQFFVSMAILGFTSFELENAFSGKIAAKVDSYNSEIAELLFYFVKTVSSCLTLEGDIRRFFMYNLREFDGPFLATQVNSFNIPQQIYDEINAVISAFSTISIEEFDQGTDYDLTRIETILRAVSTQFNYYSTSHGVMHLSALFQVVSLVSIHVSFFNSFAENIFTIAPINQMWAYIPLFEELVKNDSDSACFYIAVLQLCHFYTFDYATSAEWPDIVPVVKKHYTTQSKFISDSIFSWYKGIQDNLMAISKQKVLPPSIKEAPIMNRKDLVFIDRFTKKLTQTLITVHQIGTITLFGEDHNVTEEINKTVENLIHQLFAKEQAQPPEELRTKLQIAKWGLNAACNLSHFNFTQIIQTAINALTSMTGTKLGTFVQVYKAKYGQLVLEVLPHAYFSNTQEMFIPQTGFATQSDTINQYMSLPALTTLQEIIGRDGMVMIATTVLGLVANTLASFIPDLKKVMNGDKKAFETGLCTFQSAPILISQISSIGAMLKFRQMALTVGGYELPAPHEDEALVKVMKNSEATTHILDSNFPAVFASLFSSSYWANSKYDVVHDAYEDNSHLLAMALDAMVAPAIAEKKVNIKLWYQAIIPRIMTAIIRGNQAFENNKKVDFPGMKLLIVFDHLIKSSVYADYSCCERYVSYQLIRAVYTNYLESFIKAAKKDDTTTNPTGAAPATVEKKSAK